MGYQTQHTLEINKKDDINGPLNEDIVEQIEENIASESGYYWPFEDSIKWYDCEKDMLSVSKKYPDYLLTVRGEGEESGDIWATVFNNGKIIANWSLDVEPPTLIDLLENHKG